MTEKYPKNIDPRPKRRRDRDNPYEIYSVGINTDHSHFYVAFTDAQGVRHELEIGKALFEAFNRFELDDLSFLNEVDNNYDLSDLPEASLDSRVFEKAETPEEVVIRRIQNEQLHKAIDMLSDKQRYRVILHYFGELTYAQIAEMEGCKYQTIQDSIYAALKKIKKFMG